MKVNKVCLLLFVSLMLELLVERVQAISVSPIWASTPYLQSNTLTIRVSTTIYSTNSTTILGTFVNAFSTVP